MQKFKSFFLTYLSFLILFPGKFFSLYYPSSYAKNTKCKYAFIARQDEYVRVVFEYINLQKGDTVCLNSPDYIEIHDGSTKMDPVIGLLCGVNSFFEFKSTYDSMFVQFISRSLFPGQGFRASYYFESISSFSGQKINDPDSIGSNEGTTERTNEIRIGTTSLFSYESRGRSIF